MADADTAAARRTTDGFTIDGTGRWPTGFDRSAAGDPGASSAAPARPRISFDELHAVYTRSLAAASVTHAPLPAGTIVGASDGRAVVARRVLATTASRDEAVGIARRASRERFDSPAVVLRVTTSDADAAAPGFAVIEAAIAAEGAIADVPAVDVTVTHVVFGDVVVLAPNVPGFDPWLFLRTVA